MNTNQNLTLALNTWVRDKAGNYHVNGSFTADQILTEAAKVAKEIVSEKRFITSAAAAKETVMFHHGNPENEQFGCLFMDNKHNVLGYEVMFQGTINAASVYPREIVKAALRLNAASAIICHNHPSGDPKPSDADKAITMRIKSAFDLIDVSLLDHIIVGEWAYSFSEHGIMP